jgi:hypothetical protein
MQNAELQQLVQRQVSLFCERVTQALAPLGDSSQREVSDAALRETLVYVSSAIDIATGPIPSVNLVDMLVFLRLCREALERHWIPTLYGAQGAPVVAAFSKSEDDLWSAAAPVIHASQRHELENLVGDWLAENPHQYRVEGVRLDDFSSGREGADVNRQRRVTGLLSAIRSATRAADDARLLADRGIFLTNRLPFLWRLQARLTAREIVSDVIARLAALPAALAHRALDAPTRLLRGRRV